MRKKTDYSGGDLLKIIPGTGTQLRAQLRGGSRAVARGVYSMLKYLEARKQSAWCRYCFMLPGADCRICSAGKRVGCYWAREGTDEESIDNRCRSCRPYRGI